MWNRGFRFIAQRVLLSLVAGCCLIPAGYLFADSVRSMGAFSLRQYENILLYTKEFFIWFWNSVFYTAAILALCVPTALLAAFGLTQYYFRGRNIVLFLYTLLMLLPFQATVVAQHLLLNALGLLDTRLAIILPFGFGAFGTFLLTQFLRGLDRSIIEAAQLDGAGWFQTLTQIIAPMCRPAIGAFGAAVLIRWLWNVPIELPSGFLPENSVFQWEHYRQWYSNTFPESRTSDYGAWLAGKLKTGYGAAGVEWAAIAVGYTIWVKQIRRKKVS